MALPIEIHEKERQIRSLATDGQRLQALQETGSNDSSLGMLEARLRYEKAFAELIQSLILDYGYTQLAQSSTLTMNRFNDELYFYNEEPEPKTLLLSGVLKLVETEAPENDEELIAKIKEAVTLVSTYSDILIELAKPIFLWTLSHKGQPIFKVEPYNTGEFQDGWYSAEEIQNWAQGKPTKVSKKTFDHSMTLDYVE